MLSTHFQQSLIDLMARQPFEPFDIELVSGARITVQHPEPLAVSGYGLAYYLGPGFEVHRCDHESVARIVEQASQDRSENGSSP